MKHKCLAVFIVFVLFFSISGFLYFSEIRNLTTARNLLKILSDSGAYQKLPDYLNKVEADNAQSKAMIESLARALQPNYVRAQVEKNAGPLLDYLNKKTTIPNINVDMRPIKAEIQKSLPSDPQSQQMLSKIPDFYTKDNIKNPDQIFKSSKRSFTVMRIGWWVTLGLSLFLILMLVLLGLSYWPAILRWTGWGLFIPGVLALIFSFSSVLILNYIFRHYSSGLSPDLKAMLQPIVEILNQTTKKVGMIYAGVLSGIGLILVILSYALPHSPEPQPKVTTPAKPAASAAQAPQPAK